MINTLELIKYNSIPELLDNIGFGMNDPRSTKRLNIIVKKLTYIVARYATEDGIINPSANLLRKLFGKTSWSKKLLDILLIREGSYRLPNKKLNIKGLCYSYTLSKTFEKLVSWWNKTKQETHTEQIAEETRALFLDPEFIAIPNDTRRSIIHRNIIIQAYTENDDHLHSRAIEHLTPYYYEKSCRFWNSLQRVPRIYRPLVLRHSCYRDVYQDFDIENSALTILVHQYKMNGYDMSLLPTILSYIDTEKNAIRQSVADLFGITITEAKTCLTYLTNGQQINPSSRRQWLRLINGWENHIKLYLDKEHVLHKLYAELKLLKRVVMREIRAGKTPVKKDSSYFGLYFHWEQKVISIVQDIANRHGKKSINFFDGLLVEGEDLDMKEIEKEILDKAGISIKLSDKKQEEDNKKKKLSEEVISSNQSVISYISNNNCAQSVYKMYKTISDMAKKLVIRSPKSTQTSI